jgi:hypothetical protein
MSAPSELTATVLVAICFSVAVIGSVHPAGQSALWILSEPISQV